MHSVILAIAGAVCLAVALVEAWLIVAVFSNENAVARVMRPSYLKMPPIAFKAMLGVSCVSTTVGYGATAWIIVAGPLAAANH